MLNADKYTVDLERLLVSSSSRFPHELFKSATDDFWLWLNTEGYRQHSQLQEILPALPAEYFQLVVASLTGDETLKQAFTVYKLFRTLIERHRKPVSDCDAVLDFGCGWGRITRFFLKDIPAQKVWGMDQWKELIEQARQLIPQGRFLHVGQDPPTGISSDMFDAVFSYSVFSHIDEDQHKRWLAEFHRILKPGGLLIATTWERDHIPFLETVCAQQTSSWEDYYNRAIAERFPGIEKALAEYDAGKFFHIDLGYPTFPTYGETCIPRKYVDMEWTKWFTILDYIDDRNVCQQDVIVARKG